MLKVVVDVPGDGNVVTNKGLVEFAKSTVTRVAAVGVVGIPTMFGMNAFANSGHPGKRYDFQRREVAGVNDIRFELTQQSENARVERNGMTGRLVEGDELHVMLRNALFEVADGGQRENRVPIAVGWQVIDQLDNDIFEAANRKAVNDVQDVQALHSVAAKPALRRKASNINRDQMGAEKSRCPARCLLTMSFSVVGLK